jgi:hypothetical protein
MVSDSLSGLSLHNSITNSETLIEQEQNCISRQKKGNSVIRAYLTYSSTLYSGLRAD